MCPFLICHRAIGVDILVFRRSTYEPSSFVTRVCNPAVEQVALIERSMSKVTVCQEDTFSSFSIENEECIGHAILFYMKVSFVLGNEIIVIEQVL